MADPNDDEQIDRATRVGVRFPVEFCGRQNRGRGSGFVSNISSTGALLEGTDALLIAGAEITLRFSFFEDSTPVEVGAVVTRETSQGFGVRFAEMSPRVRAVLRMAIAKLARATPSPFDFGADDEPPTLLGGRKPTE